MKSIQTTFDERVKIVKWVIKNHLNYSVASKKFNISYGLVYKWTKQYLEDGPSSLKHKKRGPKPKPKLNKHYLKEIEKLKFEINDLKKENKKLKELLKK